VAGGASTSSGTNFAGDVASGFGDASNAYGLYSGIQNGSVTGDTSAAIDATKLANTFAPGMMPSAVTTAAGDAAPILSMYTGVQSGTPQGYAQAGTGAVQLAGQTGLLGSSGAALGATLGGAALAVEAPFMLDALFPGVTSRPHYGDWSEMTSTGGSLQQQLNAVTSGRMPGNPQQIQAAMNQLSNWFYTHGGTLAGMGGPADPSVTGQQLSALGMNGSTLSQLRHSSQQT